MNYSHVINKSVKITLNDGFTYDSVEVDSVGEILMMVREPKETDLTGVIIADIKCLEVLGEAKPKRQVRKRKSESGKSKKEIAEELHAQYPNVTRKEAIEMLMSEADMTRAGAATYYYLVWKR